MQELPLNGFYSGESRKLTDRRCINWIPTPSDAGSLSTMSLMETVGLNGPEQISDESGAITPSSITSQVFTFTTFQGKSAVAVNSAKVFFRAINGANYTIQYPNAAGDPAPVRAEYARMATNGLVCVVICPSSKGFNPRDKLAYFEQDPNINAAFNTSAIFGYERAGLVDVTYAGGRFLYVTNEILVSGLNRVFYSEIGNVEPDALNFFAPDNLASQLKGIDVINDRIYLFSEDKTFIYNVNSSPDIPFRDVGEIEFGLYDADSKCRYKGAIAGLFKAVGGAYSVGLLSGGGIQRISSPSIDYQIQKAINLAPSVSPEEIRLFSFSDKGRDMLCITCSKFTFCFEAATGMWHERKTLGDRDNWQFIGAADTPDSSIFVGDEMKEGETAGTITAPFCSTNYDIGTENSSLVERLMISAPFNASNQRIMVDEIQPQCEIDYSAPIEGWQEPKINLSVSNDFGNTFEQERGLNIGRAGNFSQETRFFNIGYYTQTFTVRLRSLNPYPTRIIRLLNRMTKGGA